MKSSRVVASIAVTVVAGSAGMNGSVARDLAPDAHESSAVASAAPDESRVQTVRGLPPTAPTPPAALEGLASELADLVDFHSADFAGVTWEPEARSFRLLAASPESRLILRSAQLDDNVHVIVEEGPGWSLRSGQRMLEQVMEDSGLARRASMWGISTAGAHFEVAVPNLNADERAALAELPGTVTVYIGESVGMVETVGVELIDPSPFAGGGR